MREIAERLNRSLALWLLDVLQRCDHWVLWRRKKSRRSPPAISILRP